MTHEEWRLNLLTFPWEPVTVGAYADWLEEQGVPLAQLLSMRLAHLFWTEVAANKWAPAWVSIRGIERPAWLTRRWRYVNRPESAKLPSSLFQYLPNANFQLYDAYGRRRVVGYGAEAHEPWSALYSAWLGLNSVQPMLNLLNLKRTA